MSVSQKLEERLKVNLAQELGYDLSTEDGVSGIDFSILLEELLNAVIDLVLNLLNGCLKEQSKETVASNMTNPGIIEKWAIRQAVYKSEVEAKNHRVVIKSVTKTLDESDEEEVVGLLVEVENKKVDWTLF